jgi:hypothetical protein
MGKMWEGGVNKVQKPLYGMQLANGFQNQQRFKMNYLNNP